MLHFEHISKNFGPKQVLDDITISFAPRQTHVLIGSSGSGKTTLLKILLGLETADRGVVRLDQAELNPNTQREWAQRIGYVPQMGGLFPHLTARDNVTLVARTLGWNKERIAERLEDLRKIEAIEPEMLTRFPKALSGGQQQRISIMRAAFLDPAIMVLDEPLGALDPILRSELQEQLKEIFNRLNKTVLMVTHDLGEAVFFGHSITLLHEAHIEQTGPIEAFIERPVSPFVTQFLSAQRTLQGLRPNS